MTINVSYSYCIFSFIISRAQYCSLAVLSVVHCIVVLYPPTVQYMVHYRQEIRRRKIDCRSLFILLHGAEKYSQKKLVSTYSISYLRKAKVRGGGGGIDNTNVGI